MNVRVPLAIVVVTLSGLALVGCGLKDVARQLEAAGSVQQIRGRVEIASGLEGRIHVVLFRQSDASTEFVILDEVLANPTGYFRASVAPGDYFVGAYQDTNGDGTHQRDTEPAAYFHDGGLTPRPFTVTGAGPIEIEEPLVVQTMLANVPEVHRVDGAPAIVRNIGRVVSLDDPMFAAEMASVGTWRPVDFLRNVGGGLFMLEPYDPERTPVIFVHGVNGSPADLRAVIGGIDHTRFQSWVLHYPSGLRLDVIADYLDRATDLLQHRYRFERLFVVGYSMGGLISREFVLNHTQRGHRAPVEFFVTISSPMMGMASAARGVRFSPVVVPSWRDVAAGSAFVQELHERQLPAAMEYHLVFSHLPGRDGDGIVPIGSQIPRERQDEADRLHGFEVSHAGILRDAEFVRRFAAILVAALDARATP